ALSQTVCNRKSEISAFVEKKTGFDGSRTLIHCGFCVWCRAGSIFAQDISKSYNVQNVTKVKSPGGAHFVSRIAMPASRRTSTRTISVCLDSATALASPSWHRFCPARLQIQAGLDSKFGYFSELPEN